MDAMIDAMRGICIILAREALMRIEDNLAEPELPPGRHNWLLLQRDELQRNLDQLERHR